ncbi:MAG: putative glycoside hydrolase [Gemmatimonadota bacterium]|nr:putative glycoside hydrolase [Gemmatimonadota bacterium]MDH4349037.1 putative glycoside hydrolase [Gemmatimonadota bacterium]
MRSVLVLSLLALSQPVAAQTSRGGWGDELAPVVVPERLIAIGPRLGEPVEWPAPPLRRPPTPVRALYVNAWAFGGSRFRELLSLADTTEVNSLVIDVKDDTGYLTYRSEVPTAISIGANTQIRARDAAERLRQLHLKGIHPIARIVVAKDPLLAARKASWSVQHRDGGLWRDRLDFAWVDAYNDSVWIYAAELAAEAVRLGFGEVQFDYVRFPDEPRARMATAVFPSRKAGESTRDGVRRGLAILRDRVRPLGVPYTIDVFGMTTNVEVDMGIGQVWEDLVTSADVVLPMVYPSHYYHAMYGVARPNSNPYRIVRGALEDGVRRSSRLAEAAAEIRPYLQAFTLGAPRYTPEHVRAQIRAASDVGIHGWVLWNPRSAYDPRIFVADATRMPRRAIAQSAAALPREREARR